MAPTIFQNLLLAFLLAQPCHANPPRATQRPATLTQLTPGSRWLEHFQQDLLPFWNLPDAWGEPRGNFPTFRCNSGHLPVAGNPCPELASAPEWIRENLGRDYTRMKSRQTYFYGVAYHLTGDPRMLALARDGVRFLRERALEKDSGSAISYWEKGVAGPPLLQRTSQDLAYAQLGLAMYYYLTHDEAVLADILRLKAHIFGHYWDADWGMLRWVAKDEAGEDQRMELVAQLDQINAYMLLVTPILPEPHRSQWKRELITLARVMIEKYYAPDQHLFWGTIHDAKGKTLGARHTDFGHTAKALWMIERIGRLTGDETLVAFASKEAAALVKMAFLEDSGSWASKLRGDGGLDINKEWWIYAELDQITATLALGDPSYGKYLVRTYDYWLRTMVDHEGHEIHGWVNGRNPEGAEGLKIHMWKNGYHSAEHALVSYLTSQSILGKPVTLYYAFPSAAQGMSPYFFSGSVKRTARSPLPGFAGLQKTRVTFLTLR